MGGKIPSESLRRDFVLRGRVQGSGVRGQGSGVRGEAAHFVILSGEKCRMLKIAYLK